MQNVEPTLGNGRANRQSARRSKKPSKLAVYMTAFEDEHALHHKLERSARHRPCRTPDQMGVHSLKIEGRTKSSTIAHAPHSHQYIDDAAAGKPFDTSLLETLEGLAHRGYTEGSLRRHTHDDYQKSWNTVIQFLTASSLLVSFYR